MSNDSNKKLFWLTYVTNDEGQKEIDFHMLVDYFDDEIEYLESPVVYDAQLVDARKAFIEQLTPDQIVSVDVEGEWRDDHCPCVNAVITFTSGDVLAVSAMWLTDTFVGAWSYANSSDAAKSDIVEYLKDATEL